MTVDEFNREIAREKLIAPADAIVRIIERIEGEVKVEVLGRTTWVKQLKKPRGVKQRTREQALASERPYYTMPQDEIALGPSAYMLLQWMRSLDHQTFSIEYAARELQMSRPTVRKSLQLIRRAGKMPEERVQ